ncbi:hypothetical protein ACFL6Y_10585 [Elusimicrobiota bacterium]
MTIRKMIRASMACLLSLSALTLSAAALNHDDYSNAIESFESPSSPQIHQMAPGNRLELKMPRIYADNPFNRGKNSNINETRAFAVKYIQEKYMLEDLQGDVSLMVYTKGLPKALLKVLLGLSSAVSEEFAPNGDLNPVVRTAQIPRQNRKKRAINAQNNRLMIEGRENPIRAEEMSLMLTQIIAESMEKGIFPEYGTPHRWSPEFKRKYAENFPIYASCSKLLLALASGVTIRFTITEQEIPLFDWILSQKDRSIAIHDMFRKSYELNNGNAYLTLLTIQNVLSQFWRAPNRENRAISKKLSYIANFYQNRGDNFGAWHHLFGIMFYGYVTGRVESGLVAFTESQGSHVLNKFNSEQQEDWVNSQGALVGANLRKIVLKEKYLEFDPDGIDYIDPKVYLNLSEDFRDRINIVPSNDFKASLHTGSIYLESLNKDYLNCTLEIRPDLGWGVDSRDKIIIENVSISRGETFSFHNVGPTKEVRAFLTECDHNLQAAMTALDRRALHSPRRSKKIF